MEGKKNFFTETFGERPKTKSTTGEESKGSQPEWLKSELIALRTLKKNIREKYRKDIPLVKSCKNASLAQVMADDIFYKFISETLNAAGEGRG